MTANIALNDGLILPHSANPTGSNFRERQPAEAGPMPTHEGLGPDDRDGLEDRWKPSIQLDQEQAIPICELNATAHHPLQHNQLMAERSILCLKSALRY